MNFLGWKRNGSNGNNSTADVRQAEKEREMEQIEWELSQAAAAAATTTAASNPHSVPQASLMQQNRFGQQQGQAAAGGGHPPPPLSYEQQQQMYHHFLMMQQQQQQQTQPQQPHYPPPSSHLHLPPHFNFNPEFMAAWPASTTAGGVPMTIPQPPPPPPHHLMMMNYHQGLAAGGGLAGAAPPPVLHGFSNSPPNMLISNYGPAQPTGPNGLPGRERGNSGGRIPVPQGILGEN